MKYTTNFNLRKPETNETVDVADLNYNADQIDATLAAHKTRHATGGADALTPADIGAAAASDLSAHLAETVIKQNLTINVPADYPTIQAALDALKYAWIPRDVTVTIQVAAGTYTHTSPIVIDHPCGSQIQIMGATPIITTTTGVGTVSGSAGNWSVPITVADVTGIQVGQYVIIRNTTGTGDYYAHRGIWEITAVDTGTKTVTVKNTHRASNFPSATLSGGDFIVLTTILKFTDCIGLRLYDKSLGYLDNVAIVGNNSASTTVGIEVGYANWQNIRGGTIKCGNYVGVNGFAVGFAAGNGGSIVGKALATSGNKYHGFYAQFSGSIHASFSTASGNVHQGFCAQFSGSIYAYSSTASGNVTDYKAEKMGYIFCADYAGTPTFSPAVNTEGNYNAIITT